MLALTPEPADLDPALLAHAPAFAFPALALHSHAPSGSSRDGLSLLMTRTSAASGGIRMLCLCVQAVSVYHLYSTFIIRFAYSFWLSGIARVVSPPSSESDT
jgi:hypothetical protein